MDCRGRHDQGRRGELRRQRPRQHSGVRQLRDPRRRLLCRRKAATSTTSSAPTLEGEIDNADVVEEDWNDYTRLRRPRRRALADQPGLGVDAQPASARCGENEGGWETDPALGDYKITRFFDEYLRRQLVPGIAQRQGRPGLRRPVGDGSYFDRDIKYEYDNANYDQWRYGLLRRVSRPAPVQHGLPDRHRSFNDQMQERYSAEVRLTSKGESRFQWMAGAFYEDVYDWWEYGAHDPGLPDYDQLGLRAVPGLLLQRPGIRHPVSA